MKHTLRTLAVMGVVLMTMVPLGAESGARPSRRRPIMPVPHPRQIMVNIPGLGRLALSGPYRHRNLSLFYFHDTGRPLAEPNYITLEEGTASGQVKVSEQDNAQVGRLLISNFSACPLFLQIGEIVSGGKQDRTLQASLVVPAGTKNFPVPSFCVEQTRWSGGKNFAPKGIIMPDRLARLAVQNRSQSGVWSNVGSYKARANRNAATVSGKAVRRSRTSSVNEELDNADFRKLIGAYESKFMPPYRRFSRPRGLVTVVDGQISTADIYHASTLFRKLYPKLLKGSSAEAAAGRISHMPRGVTVRDVANFLRAAWHGPKRTERYPHDNVFVRITSSRAAASQLFYKDNLIHVQAVRTGGVVIRPPRPPIPIPMPRPIPPRPPHPRPLRRTEGDDDPPRGVLVPVEEGRRLHRRQAVDNEKKGKS